MEPAETPPSVQSRVIWDKILPGPGILLSRALLYVVFVLLLSAVTWAAVTEMDVVVYSRGRLMVRGEPVQVTVQEQGLVVEMRWQVGDRVNEGDVLLRLDAFKYRSDADQTQKEIATHLAEANRHREGARAIRASLRDLDAELVIARRSASIVADQLKRVEKLEVQQIAPAQDVQQKALELSEATAKVARLETQLKQAENEAAEKDRQALEARARADALAARLSQLGGLEQRMTLVAPVGGTITQLAVLHPGSVIDTDQPAVTIAPDRLPLWAALQIPNPSMRQLQGGMRVRMRFDAFPYQDFGYLDGKLVRIDPDADVEGSYRAWVSLARTQLEGPRGSASLKPGLLLDAEIIVDRRTILDFVLRPLKRLGEPIRVAE